MRKTLFFLLLAMTACLRSFAQTDELVSYLSAHQSVINRNHDSLELSQATSEMLDKAMKGKKLFVSGEGGSHFLYLNGDIFLLYIKYLAQHNLRYLFEEGARAWAVQDNFFRQHPELNAAGYYHIANQHYVHQYEQERNVYNTYGRYYTVGIDFERPEAFHDEIVKIMHHRDEREIAALHNIAPYLEDTSYIHYGSKKFKLYYKRIQDKFFEDSATIRPLLDTDYAITAYLIDNSNINTPLGSRNGPMAENLLNTIDTVNTNYIYMLDCGMAHSRPNIKGTLVNILSKDNRLKDKIAVANVLCDSCNTTVETVSNWALSFARGQIMQDFRTAAKGEIVLFDLSGLPEQYNYIKAYGDLLLFAQHQH